MNISKIKMMFFDFDDTLLIKSAVKPLALAMGI